jgi:hypothetical protein
VNTLNNEPQTNDKGWSSSFGMRHEANIKNKTVTKILKEPCTWMDYLKKRPKQQNMDMR